MPINSITALFTLQAFIFFLLLQMGEIVFAQNFSVTKLIVGTQQASAIRLPAEQHAKTWMAKTSAQVEIVQTPYGELFKRYINSLTAEQAEFDVILFPSNWMGDFHDYLEEIPKKLIEDESFDDIHPSYRERLMTWNNKWLAMTIDGDLYSGYYRTDLFNTPNFKQEFRQRYGYPLYPPETWVQYRDIAEFFSSQKDNQVKLYGTSTPFRKDGQQFWELFSRAASYTNPPDFYGAQFFDPQTMQAQINNPGWVKATREFVEMLQFSPPNSLQAGIIEARKSFVQGQTAMILDWGDTAQIAATSPDSKVKGKVGFFVLPGSTKVWDGKSWRWQNFDSPRKVPFLAFGGWVAGVPKNSKNKQAAWDYIKWLSNPSNSLQDVVSNGSGINPYRLSHFTHIDAWTKAFSRRTAAKYLDVIRNSLNSPNLSLDLRIPGAVRYTEALEDQLTGILLGHSDVQSALNKVAQKWETITDELGRQRQLKIYRLSMGLNSPLPNRHINTKKRSKDSHYTIGFSQATTIEPWRLLFNKEVRQEASKHPEINLIVRDGKDDTNKQIADMREFIDLKVDAILISPKVTDALTPMVNKAYQENIPVFVLDRDVGSKRYTQFIGGDNYKIGQAAGNYAVDLLGGKRKANGNIVEIWGGMQSSPAQQRHDGFFHMIMQEPGIKTISTPKDGDWKLDTAYNIMTEYLDKYPSINLVYAHNDPMAYGAYLAAKDRGRENEMYFLGIDGLPGEGVKWVNEGILDATFTYPPPGNEAIVEALRYLNGKPIPKIKLLESKTIDKRNAEKILNKNGFKCCM